MDIRFISLKGTTYLKRVDVVEYLRELAATEETDVRNRIEEASKLLDEVGNVQQD